MENFVIKNNSITITPNKKIEGVSVESKLKPVEKFDKPLHEYDKVISPNTGKEVDIKSIVDRIDLIRGNVYAHNPCFGALIENLNFIYTFDVMTQATDGTRLFINPEWSQTLSDGELRFVMVHELMHCVFNHMSRTKSNKRLSNIAADFEVNGASYIDKFVTTGQMDHIGTVFSYKYLKNKHGYSLDDGKDLWAFEAIYEDLSENGFIPDAPDLNIMFPLADSNCEQKGIHTSCEWKSGHKDAIHNINEILNDEYSKISKNGNSKYTTNEVSRALNNSIQRIKQLNGIAIRNKKSIIEDEDIDSIRDEYKTYQQGWDYAVNESLEQINYMLGLCDDSVQQAMKNMCNNMKIPTLKNSVKEIPATDMSEEPLNLPRHRSNSGSAGKLEPLSKEDILNQQEGANIARKAGYKGEFTKEEELKTIESKWNDAVSQIAGKEGSILITRHLLDMKASNYNWQYELKKLLNYSMNNSLKYNNEWGEKRSLARDSMSLKHKTNNNAMKDIVFLVDCSGSVSDDTLSNILSECYSISRKCNIKDITYAYFTTKVELVETNCAKLAGHCSDKAVMFLKNSPRGGHISGGTDFKSALDWVNDIGGSRCVIMLTDGYDTPVPKPGKIKNLIWVIYDNNNFKSADNSRVINLDTSKMKCDVHK